MNDPFLVPCLVALRAEFNAVASGRDKGADGWIGDRSHAQSSSDHNPDETGATPSEDPDDVDEVHALDIDSTGPWPDGKGGEAGGWFDRTIRAIAARERAEYQSATVFGRLQNIIWRGRIISRSWGWSEWRTYSGASAHFDHAHFSARYLARTEADTRPWGVNEEDDMPSAEEVAEKTSALLQPTLAQILLATRQTANSVLLGRQAADAADAADAERDALMASLISKVDEEVYAQLRAGSPEATAAVLRAVLGDQAAEVGRLLAA